MPRRLRYGPRMADSHDEKRRSLLRALTGGLVGAAAAAVAIPVAALLGTPLKKRTVHGGEDPIAVAEFAKLPEGVPVGVNVVAPSRVDAWVRYTNLPLGRVWLVKRGERVEALSSTCPHAGCFVDWEDKQQRFNCPCHASVFDLGGACVSGPSPRAMDALATEVKDGKVLVRFRRFRQASVEKIPI